MGSGEIRPGSSCSAQGPTEGGGNEGGNEGGGGSEIESGGTEDDIDEDGASLDASQTGSAEKGKKRKRKQNPGSNAEAHKIVKRCAVLWMRDPIGPTMGEATANSRRIELAREGASHIQSRRCGSVCKQHRRRCFQKFREATEGLCESSMQGTETSFSSLLCTYHDTGWACSSIGRRFAGR